MTSNLHSELRNISQDDAQRIYTALIGEPVPAVIAERFRVAATQLDARALPQELVVYRFALAHIADLEALELATRYRGRLPILTKKFQLMAYLAETLPANRIRFIKDRDSVLSAYLALGLAGLRTSVKLVRGLLLLRRLPHG